VLVALVVALTSLGTAGASGEQCRTFTPDPAAFPLLVPQNGTVHTVTTLPDGTEIAADEPFSYEGQSGNPLGIAGIVFGEHGLDLFRRCGGKFTVAQGSAEYDGNPPFAQVFDITAHPDKKNDIITIVETAHNNVPNNDGAPCSEAAPCILDDLEYQATYKYHVTTGALTVSLTSQGHVIWPDPSTGNIIEYWSPASGSASTTIPVTVDRQQLALSTQPSALKFGSLKSDTLIPKIRQVLLTNIGSAPVTITGFAKAQVSVTCGAFPFRVGIPIFVDESYYVGRVIEPGASQVVYFTFDPIQCSPADQQMVVFIQTDENSAGYAVTLTGTAR